MTKPITVEVQDTFTNNVTVYPSIAAAARAVGLSPIMFRYYLNKGSTAETISNRYIVRIANSGSVADNPTIVVRNMLTRDTIYFSSMRDAVRTTGIPKTCIDRALKHDTIRYLTYNFLMFRHADYKGRWNLVVPPLEAMEKLYDEPIIHHYEVVNGEHKHKVFLGVEKYFEHSGSTNFDNVSRGKIIEPGYNYYNRLYHKPIDVEYV